MTLWSVHSAGIQQPHAAALNNSGIPVVGGSFEQSLKVGSLDLASDGRDIFVARWLDDGDIDLLAAFGGPGDDRVLGLATDTSDQLVIVGDFEQRMVVGEHTLVAAGGTDAFAIRLGPDGDPLWTWRAGGKGNDHATEVVVEDDSTIHVCGSFSGAATFDDLQLLSAGRSDGFVVTLDAEGRRKASPLTIGGPGDDAISAVSVNKQGALCIAGSIAGDVRFGSAALKHRGGTDLFVAKIDPDGSVAWAHAAGQADSDEHADAVGNDGRGGCIVAGTFGGTLSLGTTQIESVGGSDAFVMRIDAGGIAQWSKAFGSQQDDAMLSLAIDQQRQIYAAGLFAGDLTLDGQLLRPDTIGVFMVQLSLDGTLQWATAGAAEGGPATSTVSIVVTADPGVEVVTAFRGTMDFGTTWARATAGTVDMLMLRAVVNP